MGKKTSRTPRVNRQIVIVSSLNEPPTTGRTGVRKRPPPACDTWNSSDA
jgi:hypothetical protein